jgi:hypothetical protein
MSLYLLKTGIAVVFVISGLTAFLSMMTLMGRAEKAGDPVRFRKVHRGSGLAFSILLLPLIVLGAKFWAEAGDFLSIRAGFHVVLAIAFVVLLILKITIVRVYRNFLKYVPALGMIIFTLAVIVFAISAGFTVVMKIF